MKFFTKITNQKRVVQKCNSPGCQAWKYIVKFFKDDIAKVAIQDLLHEFIALTVIEIFLLVWELINKMLLFSVNVKWILF